MQLAELIDTRETLPPVWIAYPGSVTFRVLVRPVASRLQEIVNSATELQWDMSIMRQKPVVNQDKYTQLLGHAAIESWEGLTGKDLRRLVPLTDPKIVRSAGRNEIAFDEKARALLLRHSVPFRSWIEQKAVDIERYNIEREEQSEKK